MNKSAFQDIQQVQNATHDEIERIEEETKRVGLELILGRSSSVVALSKKIELATAPKKAKRLCKYFGFTSECLKGSLAVGRKRNVY